MADTLDQDVQALKEWLKKAWRIWRNQHIPVLIDKKCVNR